MADRQDTNGESAFARFERLTKQLLDVPKAEIDEAVKKAKRERSRRQKRH